MAKAEVLSSCPSFGIQFKNGSRSEGEKISGCIRTGGEREWCTPPK
jgi:hypothetical protein